MMQQVVQEAASIGWAEEKDYAGIVTLAGLNVGDDLSPEERLRGGFLSVRFTREQIAGMAQSLGIVVAKQDEAVVGFISNSRLDFAGQPPIIRSMHAEFPHLHWQGRPLSEVNLFLYGPVCIDVSQRGKGLLRKMLEAVKAGTQGRFEAGVAFVAEANPRSLAAHVEGLGMSNVGRFEHQHNGYRVLVFGV